MIVHTDLKGENILFRCNTVQVRVGKLLLINCHIRNIITKLWGRVEIFNDRITNSQGHLTKGVFFTSLSENLQKSDYRGRDQKVGAHQRKEYLDDTSASIL